MGYELLFTTVLVLMTLVSLTAIWRYWGATEQRTPRSVSSRGSSVRASPPSAEKRLERDRQKLSAAEAEYVRIVKIIEGHAGTLVSRRKATLKHDAYGGVIDEEAWDKEKDYFLDTYVFPREHLLTCYYNKIRRTPGESIFFELDEILDRHLTNLGSTHPSRLSPDDFELACAEVFSRSGFVVQPCGGCGDQGADLIAVGYGRRLVVQCKRYTGNVGTAAVQEAAAARIFYHASDAWVVSTGQFTRGARHLGERANVRLIPAEGLQAEVTQLMVPAPRPAE